MSDISKIKLPDGTVYNFKDDVSGYVTRDYVIQLADGINIEIQLLGNRVGSLEDKLEETAAGLKLKENENGTYVLLSDDEIGGYVNNQKKASITTEGLQSETVIIGDWYIQPANGGKSLNFFRKVN